MRGAPPPWPVYQNRRPRPGRKWLPSWHDRKLGCKHPRYKYNCAGPVISSKPVAAGLGHTVSFLLFTVHIYGLIYDLYTSIVSDNPISSLPPTFSPSFTFALSDRTSHSSFWRYQGARIFSRPRRFLVT